MDVGAARRSGRGRRLRRNRSRDAAVGPDDDDAREGAVRADSSSRRSRIPPNLWRLKLKTHGVSDAYVIDNTFAANGGTSGWHSHPGPSLIFVIAGTITNYM